jgi:serine/threonine protein kinase
VYLTNNLFNTEHKVAVKVLNKGKLRGHLDAIDEEIAILHKLDHPYVVKYYETYRDDKFIYLVMEHITGKDFFNVI